MALFSKLGTTGQTADHAAGSLHQLFVAVQYRYRQELNLRTRYSAVKQDFPKVSSQKSDAYRYAVCMSQSADSQTHFQRSVRSSPYIIYIHINCPLMSGVGDVDGLSRTTTESKIFRCSSSLYKMV
jgi:hypothetical protein